MHDATANLISAQSREVSARRSLNLARDALGRARRISNVKGDISELEMIMKRRNVHTARLAHISAKLDRRRATSTLLAAKGILTQELALQGAINPFDAYRIKLLAVSKAAPSFIEQLFDKITHHDQHWK